MTKMILDPALRAQFDDLEEAEVCDESGRTLGYFLSEQVFRRLLFDWANAQISDHELQHRLAEPGGRALAEIWARLGQP